MSQKSKALKTLVYVTNIPEYVTNKNIRKYTPTRITPKGEVFYFYKGEYITQEKFFNLFPLNLIPINDKGKNCDPKQDWFK